MMFYNPKGGGTYCFWCGSCRHPHPHSFFSVGYLLNQWMDFSPFVLLCCYFSSVLSINLAKWMLIPLALKNIRIFVVFVL